MEGSENPPGLLPAFSPAGHFTGFRGADGVQEKECWAASDFFHKKRGGFYRRIGLDAIDKSAGMCYDACKAKMIEAQSSSVAPLRRSAAGDAGGKGTLPKWRAGCRAALLGGGIRSRRLSHYVECYRFFHTCLKDWKRLWRYTWWSFFVLPCKRKEDWK